MSSLYVRNIIEGWLSDAAMTVKFYPTINEEQNPSELMWCTCKYASPFRETLTFCEGSTSEEGDVEIRYFGQAGIGDDALLTAMELDLKTLMAQRDSTQKLTLVQRSAPFEQSDGSAKSMYAVSAYVDYQYFE